MRKFIDTVMEGMPWVRDHSLASPHLRRSRTLVMWDPISLATTMPSICINGPLPSNSLEV